MAKSRRGQKDKEWDETQKLKEQNKQLRQQIAKLRNVVNNIDTCHYKFVQDLATAETKKEAAKIQRKLQAVLEEKWGCNECGKGVLRLVILQRAGDPYYLRKCDCCPHRTRLKPYQDDVEGA